MGSADPASAAGGSYLVVLPEATPIGPMPGQLQGIGELLVPSQPEPVASSTLCTGPKPEPVRPGDSVAVVDAHVGVLGLAAGF